VSAAQQDGSANDHSAVVLLCLREPSCSHNNIFCSRSDEKDPENLCAADFVGARVHVKSGVR
jgi:hypothetical protein